VHLLVFLHTTLQDARACHQEEDVTLRNVIPCRIDVGFVLLKCTLFLKCKLYKTNAGPVRSYTDFISKIT
jgi:hypothetical protein